MSALEYTSPLPGTLQAPPGKFVCHGCCVHWLTMRMIQVLYRCHFSEQFSIAHDIYLDVLHAVNVRVATALERTTPNWCMLNACAPCLYHLEGEGDMARSILPSMDGNSSLKLVNDTFRHGTTHPDGRTCHSDLFLAEDHVNRFKHKVAAVQKVRQSAHTIFFSHTSLQHHPKPATVSNPQDPFHVFPPLSPHCQLLGTNVSETSAEGDQCLPTSNAQRHKCC